MRIERGTVVTLAYELKDSGGEPLEEAGASLAYLHGGFGGIFPKVEAALQDKEAGHELALTLDPDDAFGEYDASLVHLEPRSKFPDTVKVGMQFEGRGVETGATLVYTVTDVAEDKVVVDGNHPLAGKALDFACTVASVRVATKEETSHGHVHGPHGHHH